MEGCGSAVGYEWRGCLGGGDGNNGDTHLQIAAPNTVDAVSFCQASTGVPHDLAGQLVLPHGNQLGSFTYMSGRKGISYRHACITRPCTMHLHAFSKHKVLLSRSDVNNVFRNVATTSPSHPRPATLTRTPGLLAILCHTHTPCRSTSPPQRTGFPPFPSK